MVKTCHKKSLVVGICHKKKRDFYVSCSSRKLKNPSRKRVYLMAKTCHKKPFLDGIDHQERGL